MRHFRFILMIVAFAALFLSQQASAKNIKKMGLSQRSEFLAEEVTFLFDETWTDVYGTRHVKQEIFDSVFEMIDQADQFILLDLFLLNEFGYNPKAQNMRPLGPELTEKLIQKRKNSPNVEIIFITDPVNTFYGSLPSAEFEAMENSGIKVVFTELNELRDSNPIISKPWRLLVKPFGVGPGNAIKNPVGEGRVSIRSVLKMLNIKANHRKLVVTDKSLLVTSANPHSASSAHWNVALRVDGGGQKEAVDLETAVLNFSGAEGLTDHWEITPPTNATHKVELLSEIRIKERVIEMLDAAEPGARVDLCMFYLSEQDIIRALIRAKKRGADLRVLLDPSKDSFNRVKSGIPNRQSATRLVKAGIPVRWTITYGEQCHVKMLYAQQPNGESTILLGSCNYTRRNTDDFNCEANIAFTAPDSDPALTRARDTFDSWWKNDTGRAFSISYETYKDESKFRRFTAWLGERTGLSSF